MRRLKRKTALIALLLILACVCLLLGWTRNDTSVYFNENRLETTEVLLIELRRENRKLRRQLSKSTAVPRCAPCPLSSPEVARVPVEARWERQQLDHELELAPASLFTAHRVFPAEPSLGGRVVEKTIEKRRGDLQIAVQAAVKLLQSSHNYSHYEFTQQNFVEGTFRLESDTALEYELVFRPKDSSNIRVVLSRPFATPELRSVTPLSSDSLVWVVVPLAGRLDAFASFLDRFRALLVYDGNIRLTVVYFGEPQLEEARRLIAPLEPVARFVHLNETFSRAKALRVGTTYAAALLHDQDVLMFFCDVDVVFTWRFLERCRWNAIPGRQVYYPIVFSLYNPRIVYALNGQPVPPPREQLRITKETGFWRTFGYGMTCQYRSDFVRVFEPSLESRTTWGGEDVALFRRFLQDPQIRVLRATDPGLLHVYHGKRCDSSQLGPYQMRACLRSKALTEASHDQLGLLAFHYRRQAMSASSTSATP